MKEDNRLLSLDAETAILPPTKEVEVGRFQIGGGSTAPDFAPDVGRPIVTAAGSQPARLSVATTIKLARGRVGRRKLGIRYSPDPLNTAASANEKGR